MSEQLKMEKEKLKMINSQFSIHTLEGDLKPRIQAHQAPTLLWISDNERRGK